MHIHAHTHAHTHAQAHHKRIHAHERAHTCVCTCTKKHAQAYPFKGDNSTHNSLYVRVCECVHIEVLTTSNATQRAVGIHKSKLLMGTASRLVLLIRREIRQNFDKYILKKGSHMSACGADATRDMLEL